MCRLVVGAQKVLAKSPTSTLACKRILVTGGSGYIGSKIIRHLLSCGIETAAMTFSSGNSLFNLTSNKFFKIFQVNTNYDNVFTILQSYQPDIIIHLASPGKTVENQSEFVTGILNYGHEILTAMVELGINHIVNTGTYWEHFENAQYDPVDYYAACKNAFQCQLDYFSNVKGIRAVTLKLYDVYGSDDARNKLLNQLIRNAGSEKAHDLTPGFQILNYVYIDDVISAYCQAMVITQNMRIPEHRSFGVRSDENFTLQSVVHVLEHVINKSIKITWGALNYMPRTNFDAVDIIPKLPGWTTTISLKEGLQKIINSKL